VLSFAGWFNLLVRTIAPYLNKSDQKFTKKRVLTRNDQKITKMNVFIPKIPLVQTGCTPKLYLALTAVIGTAHREIAKAAEKIEIVPIAI